MTRLAFLTLALLATQPAAADQCASGQVSTHEAFEHGRFETRMRSVEGEGVVSAFFLYNLDVGCNWPAENNELDIEMTGNRTDSVQFTTHYAGLSSYTQIVPLAFNPHDAMHDYAFEWEPGIVRWFVNGELAYTQDGSYVSGLIHPMRILMNLWGVNSPSWAGNFDPSVMPAEAAYDYVRYYAYTPGNGNAGTGDNFTLQWFDDFSGPLDADRWDVSEFGGFGGNLCAFVSPNVETTGGALRLAITEPLASTTSQVSFSVDATSLDLAPTDTVHLNGTFNNWCGTCNPMSDGDGDGIWELTIVLPAGKHEFLFTQNGWTGEVGNAPLGSSCDFQPCDSYQNYGVIVPYGGEPVATETYCWSSCDSCGLADADNDGESDNVDNCVAVANPQQEDSDEDGIGNACDADFDNDCFVGFEDLRLLGAEFGLTGSRSPDLNGDGIVNFEDLALFRTQFGTTPGPSGLPNACSARQAITGRFDLEVN